MIKTYSCGVWKCNDVKEEWFKDHCERDWFLKTNTYGIDGMPLQESFDEGGVFHQMALNYLHHEGATSTMEENPHKKWKECPNKYFAILSFLLTNWRRCKRLSFFQVCDAYELLKESLSIKGENVGINIIPKV